MKKNIHVPLPLNLTEEICHLFEPYTDYTISNLKIKKLRNVFVSYNGLVMNNSGLVKECHHDYPDQYKICSYDVYAQYKRAEEDPANLINLDDENIYLLIHHPWYNYYHWMCECILRLWLVKDLKDKVVLLLPDFYSNSDFIQGSLKPFNFKKIFYIPGPKSLFIKNLLMPEIKPICDAYHIEKLIQIRELYLRHASRFKSKYNLGDKIYLSRKKAIRKKVINESTVEELMKSYGFTIINNEDYSFFEQICIYSNARFLVSINGSGLTNMLFMKKGSRILEILKAKTNTLNRPSFVFWYQASALGFGYFTQICPPITQDDDYFYGDFLIDIKLLEKNVGLMLAGKK